jgi:hypothetical protein
MRPSTPLAAPWDTPGSHPDDVLARENVRVRVGRQRLLRVPELRSQLRDQDSTCCVGKSRGSVTLSMRIVIRTASTGVSGIVGLT